MRDKNIENYYNCRAPEYELIYFREMPDRRKEIDDEVGYIKKLCAGKEVLEIACGTGYWTERISETAVSITACDISSEMLNIAKNKKYRCPIYFVRSNLNQLPFATHSFDIVILGFWFSHHPRQDYRHLFKNISTPLKSGCPIWMIDNNPPAEGPAMHSHHIDEFGNNFKSRYLDKQEEYVILKNYFEKDELREIFTPHFKIDRLIYSTFYWSVVLFPII